MTHGDLIEAYCDALSWLPESVLYRAVDALIARDRLSGWWRVPA